MKRSILFRAALLLTALSVTLPTMAEKINVAQAKTIAKRFTGKALPFRTAVPQSVSPALSLAYKSGAEELYAFNVGHGSGFVLVAGDDLVKNPVLGYCDEGTFNYEQLEGPAKGWVEGYAQTIAYARANNIVVESSSALASESNKAVEPLLTTKWNQYPYYNALCPEIDGRLTMAGCGATAMAQIMKYYNYPEHGWGSHGYSDSTLYRGTMYYYDCFADFGHTTYDWANMPVSVGRDSTEAQKNAVATLMYHCGVAVNTNYRLLDSGAFDKYYTPALVKYFGYDKGAQYLLMDYYTLAEWTDSLKADLDAALPVLYIGLKKVGAGHVFLLDGYNAEGYFHVNWGWGGLFNGYYSLLEMNPGYSQSGYTESQRALLHIMPDKGGEAKIVVYTNKMSSEKDTVKLDTCGGKVYIKVNYCHVNADTADVTISLTLENKADGGTQELVRQTVRMEPWPDTFFDGDKKCDFNGVKDGEYKLWPTYGTANVSKRKARSWNVYQGYLDVTVKDGIVTFGEDELTGINPVLSTPNAAAKGDGIIFNLWGRKAGTDWEKLSPGIYLKDGEKIIKN